MKVEYEVKFGKTDMSVMRWKCVVGLLWKKGRKCSRPTSLCALRIICGEAVS